MIDSHTHIQLISYYDLKLMHKYGIDSLVTCVGSAPVANSYLTIIDVMSTTLNLYRKNGREIGIDVFLGMGINPRNIPMDWEKSINAFSDFINKNDIIAIGEVGLDSGSDIEINVFREMVKLAKDYEKPLIIHTPNERRLEIVNEEIKIIEEIGISKDLVEIDHAGMDILPLIKEHGLNFGITVKVNRLSKNDVLKNIHEFERGMLNSDVTNVNDSDPLAVPNTVKFLKNHDVKDDIIERIADRNARKFFRI